MKPLCFVLSSILVLICSLQLGQAVKQRRFFENLGRIHDAIHELTNIGELPPRTEEDARTLGREIEMQLERPGHRNRQDRFG